jgi:hypothetical protein
MRPNMMECDGMGQNGIITEMRMTRLFKKISFLTIHEWQTIMGYISH